MKRTHLAINDALHPARVDSFVLGILFARILIQGHVVNFDPCANTPMLQADGQGMSTIRRGVLLFLGGGKNKHVQIRIRSRIAELNTNP